MLQGRSFFVASASCSIVTCSVAPQVGEKAEVEALGFCSFKLKCVTSAVSVYKHWHMYYLYVFALVVAISWSDRLPLPFVRLYVRIIIMYVHFCSSHKEPR